MQQTADAYCSLSGDWKSKLKMLVDLAFDEGLLPSLSTATLLLCLRVVERLITSLMSCLRWTQISFVGTLPHDLITSQRPSSRYRHTGVGGWVAAYESGGTRTINIQSRDTEAQGGRDLQGHTVHAEPGLEPWSSLPPLHDGSAGRYHPHSEAWPVALP